MSDDRISPDHLAELKRRFEEAQAAKARLDQYNAFLMETYGIDGATEFSLETGEFKRPGK